MLKRFFVSFLGSLAGICVAGILGFFLLIAMFAVSAASEMESSNDVAIKKGSILHIDLAGVVSDRYVPLPILDRISGGDNSVIALNDLVAAIDRASTDNDIEGIYLECSGASAGLAQIQAIMTALEKFKKSGKWIYSYSDAYTQGNYFLATVSDSIFINPVGMLDLHGLSSTTMFFKDFLDKVGVEVQVVKVGTYKSAVEPFILNDMSEANREQLNHFLGNMWRNIASSIAENRGIDTTAVDSVANGFSFTADVNYYISNKLVDRAVYRRQMDDVLAAATGKEKPNLVDFNSYLQAKGKTKTDGAKIAVLYAVGDITESGSDGIASERLVPQILKLAKDKKIDGLVLRVNSPGGSAFASEQIWEALESFKKETGKPYYVSMADYAASGGYYISCGADKIYAEPLTLTGSIGIFGMIPNAQQLLSQKLGINTVTVATSKGELPNFFKAMTPEQAAAMQNSVNRGYELFVGRCAAGRNKKVEEIKAIAEGRVWDGESALRLGLVDKLGGLDMALADMAAKINEGTDKTGYTVIEYPKVKLEWWEELMKLNSQFSERAVSAQLGDAAQYYYVLKNMKSMSPVQCRMDFVEIH